MIEALRTKPAGQ